MKPTETKNWRWTSQNLRCAWSGSTCTQALSGARVGRIGRTRISERSADVQIFFLTRSRFIEFGTWSQQHVVTVGSWPRPV